MTWIDPDDTPSNPTHNPSFNDLVERTVSRRTVLAGGASTAAMTVFAGASLATVAAATPRNERYARGDKPKGSKQLGFTAVAPSKADQILVPVGYSADVIAPWGDPIVPSGPAFRDDASNSAADQAQQMGQGHDGMAFFPIDGSSSHGLLAINHEYTVRGQLFPVDHYMDPNDPLSPLVENTAETVRKEENAHGISIIEVRRIDGVWQVVESDLARRITPLTEMRISGPAAGHDLLRWGGHDGTTTDGTLNNCSSGTTPWGTYVTCEENFNAYFWDEGEPLTADQRALLDRYGFTPRGFDYPWGGVDPRWRADLTPGRTNTLGWNVEIDPFDPTSTPVKRTAMGRFKHEGATFTEGKGGTVVCYMGDDERFDYLYKYVSADKWEKMFKRGVHPLDDGTLYVARFNEDGSGDWLPLVHGSGPLTAANGFADQAEVLIRTRMAADAVGATKMDRPEWTAVHPKTGEVFVTLTNNTRRTEANAANPQLKNANGHIISILEDKKDNAATRFVWDFFLMGGDGSVPAGLRDLPFVEQESAFGSPDGLGFDQDGRLWIQTDGTQPIPCNDQMLAADVDTGDVKRFLVAVPDCEVTGLTFTPDGRTVFINIQHPGENGPPSNPIATSAFPYNASRPRSATVVITKDDGGVIGT